MNLPTLKKDGRHPKEESESKFEWHDGVSTLVRIVILGWWGDPDTELCIDPRLEQRQIDPTFIASVFTGCLGFSYQTSKKRRKGG